MVTFAYVPNVPAERRNWGLQLLISGVFVELIAFVIGVSLARKTFRGVKPILIAFFSFLILSVFLLLSILWWDFFPTCVNLVTGKETTFENIANWMIPFLFLAILAAVVLQRKAFHIDVFTYLLAALFFRTTSSILPVALSGTCSNVRASF
jgi:hypothetical protein